MLMPSATAEEVSTEPEDVFPNHFSMPFTSEQAENNFEGFADAKYEYVGMTTWNLLRTATIVGQIYDKHSYEPISNAVVEIAELDIEITTDSNGAFEISGIPEGDYNVLVSATGYCSASYYNMPARNSSGADFYFLPVSENVEISFDYLQNIENTALEEISQQSDLTTLSLEGSEEVVAAGYTLKSFTAYFEGEIYSFGSDLDSYLYCVVGTEMPVHNWGLSPTSTAGQEALKVQAVTARSFIDGWARQGTKHYKDFGYGFCSTANCCHAFNPYYTTAAVVNAVNAVSGEVLKYTEADGDEYRVISEYHAVCAGEVSYTPNAEDRSIVVTQTCNFHEDVSPNGHGRGLCQVGAMRMAEAGASYDEILEYYFAGSEVVLATLPTEEGIDVGDTVYFRGSDGEKRFITYIPTTATYTFTVPQMTSGITFSVYRYTRTAGAKWDVVNTTLVGSTTSNKLELTLSPGDYLVEIKCTSAENFTSLLSIDGKEGYKSIRVNSGDSAKTAYFVFDILQKKLKFIPTQTGTYEIKTIAPLISGTTDTFLQLRDSNESLIQENDDISESNRLSSITVNLIAGQTYYITVGPKQNLGSNYQCAVQVTKK